MVVTISSLTLGPGGGLLGTWSPPRAPAGRREIAPRIPPLMPQLIGNPERRRWIPT